MSKPAPAPAPARTPAHAHALVTPASVFQFAGASIRVRIDGQASRFGLRNISGFNWPSPPLDFDHVTYCYIDDEKMVEIQKYANQIGAELRSEEVWTDGNRQARLVYHGDGENKHLTGTASIQLVVEDVIEGSYKGSRWVHLVYVPDEWIDIPKPETYKPNAKTEKKDDEGNDEDKTTIKLSQGKAMKFEATK